MAKAPRKKLGRGLSALLDAGVKVDSTEKKAEKSGRESEKTVAIEHISPGKFQPRQLFSKTEIKELADSIKTHGILQPILVRPRAGVAGAFEIVAGERRWRAAQLARLHEVPVLVRDFSDGEALEVGLVENLQRENLSPLEEAEGYRRLVDEFSHTQDEIATTLGKSRPYVTNIVRLLNLPDPIKNMLRSGDLSVGHARALLNAQNPVELAKKVIKQGLSVRQTENLAKARQKGPALKEKMPKAVDKDVNVLALEKDLSKLLGLKVDIDFNLGRGSIRIAYDRLEQLDSVLYMLSQGTHGRQLEQGDE